MTPKLKAALKELEAALRAARDSEGDPGQAVAVDLFDSFSRAVDYITQESEAP